MNFQINEQAATALSKRKKHNIYLLALSIAAVFTVVGVVIVLTRPGHAFSSLEKTLECHVEVHQHTADCYDAEGNLICGYADYVAHVHDPELCYDENGDLICELPEIIPHEHDDSCYLERMVLVCGCEEGQVVDSQGNPVFDAAGNPVYDIANVPVITGISVEGDVIDEVSAEDTEIVDVEDAEATDVEDADADAEDADVETEATDAEDADAEDADAEATDAEDADADTDKEATDLENTDADVNADAEEKKEDTETTDVTENTENTEATDDTASETTDNIETTDANAAEETAAEDEIITETVDLGQNAGLGEEEYSYHVHTAECYAIEKELICTIPTLHVHTADCYDEDGKLICGQLQLTMHVHGEECFHFEEKTVTQTAVAGDYTITATYGASAKIPSKAELVVDIIDNGEGTSQEAQEALNAYNDENAKVVAGFDIRFIFNGEEIQPEGPVNITITLNGEDAEEDQVIDIIHLLDDGQTENFTDTVNGNGEVSFDATSFSPYFLLKSDAVPPAGKYNNTILGYNDVKNGYSDSFFDTYKLTNGIFGDIASNFHVVAFKEATLAGHCNGNILVKKLVSAQDFGTNSKCIDDVWHRVNEISYIQELGTFTGRLDQETGGDDDNHVTVLGSGTKVTINTDEYKVCINDTKLDNNTSRYTIIDTDTKSAPFIDLVSLKNDMLTLSDSLYKTGHENPDINIKYDFTTDENKRFILLTDPDVAGYINLTAAQVDGLGQRELRLYGFQTGSDGREVRNGTIIINVDCTGAKSIQMPTKAEVYSGTEYYIDNNGKAIITKEGKAADRKETTDFSAGKVIWNFHNADGVEINAQEMTGCILAPGATLHVMNSNGNFIADYFTMTGETHRTDFRGTEIPFKASFTGHKTMKGEKPLTDQVFQFKLSEYVGGEWKEVQTVSNNGTSIMFSTIKYERVDQLGLHWYKIEEIDKSGDTEEKKYGYDKSVYYIAVTVSKNGSNYTASYVYYKYPGTTGITITDGNIVPDPTFVMDGTSVDFDNTPNNTNISVTKKWVDYKGDNLEDNFPENLTVYLYSTMNDQIDIDSFAPGETVEGVTLVETQKLNKGNNWYYEWPNLPSEDENTGKLIYYFVKEETVTGFDASSDRTSWFEKGPQILINKKPYEFTSFEINKKFVAYNFSGVTTEGSNLLVLDSPFLGETFNPESYVTFAITRIPTVDGVEGTKEYYKETVVVNGEDVTGGIIKVKAGENNDWHCLVEKLPAAEFKDGAVITYEYNIEETTDKSDDDVKLYTFKQTKEDLVGTGKDRHKVFTVLNLLGNTEFEIDKTWLNYTGTPATSLQTSKDSTIKIPISIVQFNEDKSSSNDFGSYLLGANSITDKDKNAVNNASLVPDNTSETGYKLWAAKFTDLPAYYAEKVGDKVILKKYVYSAVEGTIEGFQEVTEPITDDNGNVIAEASKHDTELTGITYTDIVLVNRSTSTFELPETGGSGRSIIPVYIAGAVVILSLIALLAYRKKLRRN